MALYVFDDGSKTSAKSIERRKINPKIWIEKLEPTFIKNSDEGFITIISDVRFENELELLKSMKATCCFLLRPFYWQNDHKHDPPVDE